MEFLTITDRKTDLTAFTLDFSDDITRGVEFLDNEVGSEEWLLHINPELLDVRSGNSCVCGQVFQRHYSEGMERLVGRQETTISPRAQDALSHAHGFSIDTEHSDEYSLFRDAYLAQENVTVDSENYYTELDNAEQWAWSCLTEQWISTCRKLIADRGLAFKVSAAWEKQSA